MSSRPTAAAAGTIAKTISAYDMTISDAIYGPTERYVSRYRLQMMLDHEFKLLQERLAEKRGSTTRFFVFADTVAARSFQKKDSGTLLPGHGGLLDRFDGMLLAIPFVYFYLMMK